jgi:hypothetical protein
MDRLVALLDKDAVIRPTGEVLHDVIMEIEEGGFAAILLADKHQDDFLIVLACHGIGHS